MVCAYYDRTVDAAVEFAGLKIAEDPSFDALRNRYDVIRINMQEFLSAEHDVAAMIGELEKASCLNFGTHTLIFICALMSE